MLNMYFINLKLKLLKLNNYRRKTKVSKAIKVIKGLNNLLYSDKRILYVYV